MICNEGGSGEAYDFASGCTENFAHLPSFVSGRGKPAAVVFDQNQRIAAIDQAETDQAAQQVLQATRVWRLAFDAWWNLVTRE